MITLIDLLEIGMMSLILLFTYRITKRILNERLRKEMKRLEWPKHLTEAWKGSEPPRRYE